MPSDDSSVIAGACNEDSCFRFVESISEGKGGGIVATRYISPGRIVTQDRPLISLNWKETDITGVSTAALLVLVLASIVMGWAGLRWALLCWVSVECIVRCFNNSRRRALVKDKFDKLSPDRQSMALLLVDAKSTFSVWSLVVFISRQFGFPLPCERAVLSYVQHRAGAKSIEGIFETNGLPIGDTDDLGLYPVISRFNHSCANNAIYAWSSELNAQVVIAVRDIAFGEEICVSYFDCRFLPRRFRQARTLSSWSFECECGVCAMPGFHLAKKWEERFNKCMGKFTDEELDEIPAHEWNLISAAKETDASRSKLFRINGDLNNASSLHEFESLIAEMSRLYHAANILPNAHVNYLMVMDALHASVRFGGQDSANWCCQAYELSKLLYGERHPKTLRLGIWMSSSPSIEEVESFSK